MGPSWKYGRRFGVWVGIRFGDWLDVGIGVMGENKK